MDTRLLDDEALRALLRHRLTGYRSHRAFAHAHGIDPGWLCHVLQGHSPVGPQIAAVLGYVPVIGYQPSDGATARGAEGLLPPAEREPWTS